MVGQPAQGSGKQGSSSAGHAASSPMAVTQQAIRVTAGQKAAILAQVSIDIQRGQTVFTPSGGLTVSCELSHRWWVRRVHR